MVTTIESVRKATTIDVEDCLHADALDPVAPHGAWSRHQVRATFLYPYSEASCGRAGKAFQAVKRPSNPCGADHDSVS